ncbi:MAG TPA: glycoside hydrolase family 125 protein, partial [Candidatus Limnocylindrales bacterium]|nr:glycoside hydrolase family 125 protein [Candidatus Limnocylindrales bacterium]
EAGPLPPLRLRFEGRLDRPALAEITETDPPAPSGATTVLQANGSRLLVASPELESSFTIDAGSGTWSVVGSGAELDVPARRFRGGGTIATVRCTSELAIALPAVADPAAAPEPPIGDAMRPIVWRALAYVRGCTALATSPDERVILADHRILPLSWTRDAYFQALLLLARDGPGDRRRVSDHLRWLWRRCDRPDGRWVRSHHADGRRKDLAFQADQQLYPILELADFWRRYGTLPDGVAWSREVARAWSAALGEVDPTTGLLACTENAADDPAPEPFLASSQVVLWYAARRLVEMARAGVLALRESDLRAVAERTREAFGLSLLVSGRWAYAGDGAGRQVEYHDANDLPTALAPLWGFCPADDPAWLATIEWAFSPANPGYFAGDRGGLGSIHTPGAWTLGDVQHWLVARTVGDEETGRTALERLRDVAFDDGMLPEAYSAGGPDSRVRHWFAWPGAAIGAFLVLDARGELESVLRA